MRVLCEGWGAGVRGGCCAWRVGGCGSPLMNNKAVHEWATRSASGGEAGPCGMTSKKGDSKGKSFERGGREGKRKSRRCKYRGPSTTLGMTARAGAFPVSRRLQSRLGRVPHVSILRHGFAGCGSGQQDKQILRLRLRMTSRKSAATEYRGPSTTLGDDGNGGRVHHP